MLKKLQFPCFSHCSKSITFMISLRPNPVSFVHCQGFLRNLSMSLHSNRWHMAYFLCNFQGFPLLWAASAKMLKKLQFPSFQWVSLPFSSFSFTLGRSIRENGPKGCHFHAFRTAGKPHFYDFIAPKPSFFRPLPRFPAEFEHDTTYKQMAHGLFSLQCSRFSFALGGFCHFHPFNGFLCSFLGFPLLWAASAKNAEKVVISRFPSDFEHVTNADGAWLIFPANFNFFLCFGRLLPNC